jgi:hypothetical protein
VVVIGWIGMFFTSNNIGGIRVIRILRPLRTINSIPRLKAIVQAFLKSLPIMADIMILFLFTVLMFATIATQLFGGILSKKCVGVDGEPLVDPLDDYDIFCND